MNWIKETVLPRFKAFVNRRETEESLWEKCKSCNQMIFHKEYKKHLNVCNSCGFHGYISARDRLEYLFDQGTKETIELENISEDPLNFKDLKKYSDRIKDAQAKTNLKDAIIKETNKLKVGNPKDTDSNLGAVVSKSHMEKILTCIEKAKQEGGKIIVGGNRVILDGELKNGYYIEPTIIDGLSANSQTNKEEIFGPVVSMIPFKTEEEVITMANSTKYGLSASLFSDDISRAHRVAAAIDSGVVWVNTWMLRDLRIPFGGMKSSGVGREGGFKSLQFFTEPKNVCIKI